MICDEAPNNRVINHVIAVGKPVSEPNNGCGILHESIMSSNNNRVFGFIDNFLRRFNFRPETRMSQAFLRHEINMPVKQLFKAVGQAKNRSA